MMPMTGESSDTSALDEAIGEVEQEFGSMYTHMRHVLMRRAEAVHPELTVFGFKALRMLSHEDGLQQGIIAERLFTDKGVVSRVVRQLESLGLVRRDPDPTDGRAQIVSVTDEGRDRLDQVVSDDRSMLRARLSTWELDDIRRLRTLLAKLNEVTDEREHELRQRC